MSKLVIISCNAKPTEEQKQKCLENVQKQIGTSPKNTVAFQLSKSFTTPAASLFEKIKTTAGESQTLKQDIKLTNLSKKVTKFLNRGKTIIIVGSWKDEDRIVHFLQRMGVELQKNHKDLMILNDLFSIASAVPNEHGQGIAIHSFAKV